MRDNIFLLYFLLLTKRPLLFIDLRWSYGFNGRGENTICHDKDNKSIDFPQMHFFYPKL
jgi:hypothetical protein